MKIIFTAKGKDWDSIMDSRFGRTDYLVVYDTESDTLEAHDNKSASAEAHGAGPQTASNMGKLNPDVLITGNGPGGNAEMVVRKLNIKIFVGAGDKSIKQAYEAYKNNELKEF